MTTRRFECVNAKSSKFWEITINDNDSTTSVLYGKIGSSGTAAAPKVHASVAKAQAEVDKSWCARNSTSGYVEIDAAATVDAAAATASESDDDSEQQRSAGAAKRSRTTKGVKRTQKTSASYFDNGIDNEDWPLETPFDDTDDENVWPSNGELCRAQVSAWQTPRDWRRRQL
jgi:predicted DNA-binding WGR domain protein